jgi:carnosine N-methyltransferase
LWHFENSTTSGKNGVGSIELSLDEVKELAGIVGFDIRNEEQMRTTYTGIPEGMLRHEYNVSRPAHYDR